MCPKLIDSYQQTFYCSTAQTTATFNFTRVFKQKPEQFFRIKLIYFSNLNTTPVQGLWFLRYGYVKCNFLEVSGSTPLCDNTDFYLGSFSDNGAETVPFEMIVQEIVTSPFQVYGRGPTVGGFATAATATPFLLSFQIDVLEN